MTHCLMSLYLSLHNCHYVNDTTSCVSCHQCQYVGVAKSCVILFLVTSVTVLVSLNRAILPPVISVTKSCVTLCLVTSVTSVTVSPCHYVFQWDSKQSYTYVLATVSAVFTTLFLLEVSVSSRTKWAAGF